MPTIGSPDPPAPVAPIPMPRPRAASASRSSETLCAPISDAIPGVCQHVVDPTTNECPPLTGAFRPSGVRHAVVDPPTPMAIGVATNLGSRDPPAPVAPIPMPKPRAASASRSSETLCAPISDAIPGVCHHVVDPTTNECPPLTGAFRPSGVRHAVVDPPTPTRTVAAGAAVRAEINLSTECPSLRMDTMLLSPPDLDAGRQRIGAAAVLPHQRLTIEGLFFLCPPTQLKYAARSDQYIDHYTGMVGCQTLQC
jgi:hypothetical protein